MRSVFTLAVCSVLLGSGSLMAMDIGLTNTQWDDVHQNMPVLFPGQPNGIAAATCGINRTPTVAINPQIVGNPFGVSPHVIQVIQDLFPVNGNNPNVIQ